MFNFLFFALVLVVFGLASGFVSSTPLGPINLLIADHYLSKKRLAVKSFVAGIILADLILAFAAFFGHKAFFEKNIFSSWVIFSGAVLVILLGIVSLRSALKSRREPLNKEHKDLPITKGKSSQDFIKGFFLCGFNPALLLYWVLMSSAFLSPIIVYVFGENYTYSSNWLWLLLAGIALGEFFWFVFFIKILKISSAKFGNKVLFLIRFVISVILILLGVYLFFSAGLNWI